MPSQLENPIVDQLCDEIMKARTEDLERRAKERPQEKREYLYLSDLSPCTRFMFYSLTAGDQRKPFDAYVQAMLDEGTRMEDRIAAQLAELGFRVVEKDVPVEIRNRKGELVARGRIDGKILYKKARIPMEAKMLSPNIFDRLNTAEDLFRFHWTEKYLRQLLFYLYGSGEEQGFFHLNDGRGHWKVVPVYLGQYLDYVERTLQRMEAAFEAKKSGQAPERIPYDHKLCGSCAFNAICLPTTVIEGGETLNDPDVEARIARHEELKPMASEYDDLHDSLKEFFAGKPAVTVGGRFIIHPKKTARQSYDYKALGLSKDDLEKIKKTTVSWGFSVEDVTKKGGA